MAGAEGWKGKKWKHEDVWKKWANKQDKIHEGVRIQPADAREMIQEMMATDSRFRPEIEEVETHLMRILRQEDKNGILVSNLDLLLKHLDQEAKRSEELNQDQPTSFSQQQIEKIWDPSQQ
jgi:hypothetical protein